MPDKASQPYDSGEWESLAQELELNDALRLFGSTEVLPEGVADETVQTYPDYAARFDPDFAGWEEGTVIRGRFVLSVVLGMRGLAIFRSIDQPHGTAGEDILPVTIPDAASYDMFGNVGYNDIQATLRVTSRTGVPGSYNTELVSIEELVPPFTGDFSELGAEQDVMAQGTITQVVSSTEAALLTMDAQQRGILAENTIIMPWVVLRLPDGREVSVVLERADTMDARGDIGVQNHQVWTAPMPGDVVQIRVQHLAQEGGLLYSGLPPNLVMPGQDRLATLEEEKQLVSDTLRRLRIVSTAADFCALLADMTSRLQGVVPHIRGDRRTLRLSFEDADALAVLLREQAKRFAFEDLPLVCSGPVSASVLDSILGVQQYFGINPFSTSTKDFFDFAMDVDTFAMDTSARTTLTSIVDEYYPPVYKERLAEQVIERAIAFCTRNRDSELFPDTYERAVVEEVRTARLTLQQSDTPRGTELLFSLVEVASRPDRVLRGSNYELAKWTATALTQCYPYGKYVQQNLAAYAVALPQLEARCKALAEIATSMMPGTTPEAQQDQAVFLNLIEALTGVVSHLKDVIQDNG